MLSPFLTLLLLTAPVQDLPLGRTDTPAEIEPGRGLVTRDEGAFPGYTIVAPLNSDRVYVVDLDGEVVHEWKTPYAPGAMHYLLPSGNLLRCGRQDDNPRFHGGGIGGRIQEYDWDGEVVWDFELASDARTQHHDVEPLPNGNLLVIAWESKTAEEAIARGRDPRHVGDEGFWPDMVLEVRPTRPVGGEIVWEWHVWDHLIQDFDPEKAGYGSIPDHPELVDINADHRDKPPLTAEERAKQEEVERQMRALGYVGGDEEEEEEEEEGGEARKPEPDWLHTNAVSYHPGLDLIALSTPRMSEIWVIDHSTTTTEAAGHTGGRFGKGGDLLYRWGNPRNYGAGRKKDQKLAYQHDPTWLTGAEGLRLLVFNNGGWDDDDFSQVLELALPFDAERGFRREAGKAFGPAEPVWSYQDPESFHARFISGAQRLPNGNTLICDGPQGRLFEVTPAGAVVWDYLNPHGGEVKPTEQSGNAPAKALFRPLRVAADHPGLKGRL